MDTLITAIILNVLLGLAAWKKGTVSNGGCITGIITGTAIYFFGGLLSWILLVTFFISSSLLSLYKKSQKTGLEIIHQKNERRDSIQVAANSFLTCIFSILYFFSGDPAFLIIVAVSLAASNADTWASELGVLSRKEPVSIITLKKVPPGTSGGVSLAGFIASLAGSSVIAGVFSLLAPHLDLLIRIDSKVIIFIISGGFLGSIVDSILGATLQAQYRESSSGKMTERPHSKNMKNSLVRGYAFINNDMVNFLSTCCAAFCIYVFLQ